MKLFGKRYGPTRAGAASVELALCLPLLILIFVIGADWARIFYNSLTIGNCARNGAYYWFDSVARAESPYGSTTAASQADAYRVGATTITQSAGTGSDGSGTDFTTATVDVANTFGTVSNWPGVPKTMTVHRTITIREAQAVPD